MLKLWGRLTGWRTSLVGALGLGVGSTEMGQSSVGPVLDAVAGVITGPGSEAGGTAVLFAVLYQAYKKWASNRRSK